MIKLTDSIIIAGQMVAHSMPIDEVVAPVAETGFFVTRGIIPGYTSWHSFKETETAYEICWKSTS